MAPQVLHRVCYGSSTPSPWQSSLLKIRPAILPSYCRRQVRSCDYPAITPSPNSTVRGAYVTGLTEGDLWRLDIFEGDEYERRVVKVRLLEKVGDDSGKGNVEGEEVEAETYVWISKEESLEEGEWDFEVFRREKMGRWVGEGVDGEYSGRDYILSLCPLSGGKRAFVWANIVTEVDEAVKAKGEDPTGGRGLNGNISNQLNSARSEDMLKSAV